MNGNAARPLAADVSVARRGSLFSANGDDVRKVLQEAKERELFPSLLAADPRKVVRRGQFAVWLIISFIPTLVYQNADCAERRERENSASRAPTLR